MKDNLEFNKTYRNAKKDKIFQNLNTDNTLMLRQTKLKLTDELEKIQNQYSDANQKEIMFQFKESIISAQEQLNKLQNQELSLEYQTSTQLRNFETTIKGYNNSIYQYLLDKIINHFDKKLYMSACNTCKTLFTAVNSNTNIDRKFVKELHDIYDNITTIYITYTDLLTALYNDFKITFEDALYFNEVNYIFQFELRYGLRTNPQLTLTELSIVITQIDNRQLYLSPKKKYLTKLEKVKELVE